MAGIEASALSMSERPTASSRRSRPPESTAADSRSSRGLGAVLTWTPCSLAARIAPLGWHLDLYLEATRLDEFVPRLQALPVPYVIDHMGVVDASAGPEQSAFGTLLSMA
jgi:hypothetical protein